MMIISSNLMKAEMICVVNLPTAIMEALQISGEISIIKNMIEYTVILSWDDEAAVWIAESEELPGLILESGSFDALVERVKIAIPDLIGLEGTDHGQIRLNIKAERLAVLV